MRTAVGKLTCLVVRSRTNNAIYNSDTYSKHKPNISHIYLPVRNSVANIISPSSLCLSNLNFSKMKHKTKKNKKIAVY